MKELPSHKECQDAVEAGEDTALHKFIYDQEPAGREDEEEFRKGLLDVINEGRKATLKWVKREAISLDERGDISRKIIDREIEKL